MTAGAAPYEVTTPTRTGAPSSPEASVVDLTPWLDRPEVRRLLGVSLHDPTDADLDALTQLYLGSQAPTVVFGVREGGLLVAAVGAIGRGVGRCEILSLAVTERARRRGHARRLIDVAASALKATQISAETDSDAVGFYRACGFQLDAIGEAAPGVVRYRAVRNTDGREEPVWFSAPKVTAHGPRELHVTLPPGGNTLPVVPDELAGQTLPTFVLEWLLETDEVGQMLQALLPERFPPTTPPVRPDQLREILGPLTRTVGIDTTVGGKAAAAMDGREPLVDPDAPIPGLPSGVALPMAVLEVVEMGARVGAWLDKGHRVRRWADANGHGGARWLVPEL